MSECILLNRPFVRGAAVRILMMERRVQVVRRMSGSTVSTKTPIKVAEHLRVTAHPDVASASGILEKADYHFHASAWGV